MRISGSRDLLLACALFGLSLTAAETLLGAVYVVDPAAPESADTNSGVEGGPFKTIAHALEQLGPGDTLCVMQGNYPDRIKIVRSGERDNPIRLRAVPRRTATVAGFDVEASWIRIEGFEITADQPAVAVQLNGSHCEVVDNYIHHMRVGVAGTGGKPVPGTEARDYSAVAHNRIAYNKVFHSEYGFVLGGDDWLVENNEVERLFMYSPARRFDDCDYSRFFGHRCIQRGNYYHGSISAEIRTAHVDCLQTFTVNGEVSQDLLFENNTCFDFHQLCMVESAPHLGAVKGWTLRGNIVSANSPSLSGGWGPDIIQTPDVTIEHNTIVGVRWAAIGLRGKESTGGVIRNNILGEAERAVVDGDKDFTAANPIIEFNLAYKTDRPLGGNDNLDGRDPLFVNAAKRDFRLLQRSPAIHAGKGGTTVGALTFPNVYCVDPKHPAAADEPGWGYPAVPLASLARACALAEPGETILVRGGVYRETVRPRNDHVTIRAMNGEAVTLSLADELTGWKRDTATSWSAPLASNPKRVLRDGEVITDFSYDTAAQRVTVHASDPRLQLFEAVVRDNAIDLGGKTHVQMEGIDVSSIAQRRQERPINR